MDWIQKYFISFQKNMSQNMALKDPKHDANRLLAQMQ